MSPAHQPMCQTACNFLLQIYTITQLYHNNILFTEPEVRAVGKYCFAVLARNPTLFAQAEFEETDARRVCIYYVSVTGTCITHCTLSVFGYKRKPFRRLVLSPPSVKSQNLLSLSHYMETVSYLSSLSLNIPNSYVFLLQQAAWQVTRMKGRTIHLNLKWRNHL